MTEPSSLSVRVEPLSRMRRIIGKRLRSGLQETAQLTLTAEADVTALGTELRRLGALWSRRVSLTEAVVRACSLALVANPRLTATLVDGSRVYPASIDVGVAVALDDGLVVPVLRGVDRLDLGQLNLAIAEAAARARANRLTLEELAGGCLTVSNLGAYRIDAFTPILNPPQPMILGMGRARPRPAVVDGQVLARDLMVLSLTIDHQLIDGAPGARFLGEVIAALEDPRRIADGA